MFLSCHSRIYCWICYQLRYMAYCRGFRALELLGGVICTRAIENCAHSTQAQCKHGTVKKYLAEYRKYPTFLEVKGYFIALPSMPLRVTFICHTYTKPTHPTAQFFMHILLNGSHMIIQPTHHFPRASWKLAKVSSLSRPKTCL